MKKRILSILLTLCMVLMLCPVTAFAEDYYTVTINFKYGTLANIPEAENPHTFTVAKYEFFMLTTVENCAPYECVGWKESVSGTVYEPWESLPAANLTFDAVYQVQGSLAVTVDGFEVGNTPADCTYSFESTIPGVEFSEDDIQHIRCSKFVFINEEDDEWLPMGETEAFEAGARYRIGISLNNKGLELAPAVTVNGKTPEDCMIATSNGVPIQLQIDCYPSTPAEQSQYTITYDGGEGVEGSIPAGTKTHGTDFTLSSETFTMDGFVQTGWATSDGGEKVYDLGGTYTTNEDITLYPVWSDITKPTGEISIGTKSWKTFLNNITFGLFFKDTQTVTITASDNSGDTVTIEYLLSDNELTVAQLDSADFTAYNDLFSINPDNKYVIYAKLTDKSGNVAYINTSGIVLDATAPIIKGLENGKTYCEAQTVTVTEEYIESVKVNGTDVTLDENNQFILNSAEGTQTIVATDKAGNVSADITVTVNDGHTDNDKDHKCDFCGTTLSSHTGGTATCTAKAICEYCGKEYGEIDSSNHNLEKISANNATVTATGNKEYWHCKDCSKYFADENGTNEIKLDDTVIAKLPPEIIDGKGQSITEGESKELALRSNAAFSDFVRVELDGKTLDEKYYTVKEGSTIVTLKADYVATLSVGEHTIGIVSASGTATTTFTINTKPVVETTVPTQTEPETTVPALTENSTTVPAQTENEATVSSQSENDSMTSPETGNDSETALLLAFLLSCGGVIVVTGAYSKRKKHSAK